MLSSSRQARVRCGGRDGGTRSLGIFPNSASHGGKGLAPQVIWAFQPVTLIERHFSFDYMIIDIDLWPKRSDNFFMGTIPNLLAARSGLQICLGSAEVFLDKHAPSQYNRWIGIAFSDFAVSTREGVPLKAGAWCHWLQRSRWS